MKTISALLVAAALAIPVSSQVHAIDGYFDDLNKTAPRSVTIEPATVDRSIFDEIRDSAPVRKPEADDSVFTGE